MVSVIEVPGACNLGPPGSLLFFPAVRLGDSVMTTRPWDRQGQPAPTMPKALWCCGLAKCPRQVGEGRGPVVLVRSDKDMLDTLATVPRWSVRLGLFAQ